MKAYDYAMDKTASIAAMMQQAKPADVLKVTSLAVGGALLSANVLKSIYNKISNDLRRKSIIEDLASHDPMLNRIDREQLKEWYATMYYYAPTLTADKATVREVLCGFAQFGKVDLKTLQLLAETEAKMLNNQQNGSLFDRLLPKVQV